MLARRVVVVVLMSAGCSSSSPQSASGASSSSAGTSSGGGARDAGVPDASDWIEADFIKDAAYRYKLASCEREERCASVDGREWELRANCEAAAWQDVNNGFQYQLGYVEVAWHVTYLPSAVEPCLASIRDLPCGSVIPFSYACSAFFPLTVSLVAGNPCAFSRGGAPCSDSSVCAADPTGHCYECRVPGVLGSTCVLDEDCVSRWCDANVCAQPNPPSGEGGSCERDADCTGLRKCKYPERRCRERLSVGGACTQVPDCKLDAWCENGQCIAAPRPLGATCSRTDHYRGNQPCNVGACVFETATSPTGICALPERWPSGGEPCVDLDGCSHHSRARRFTDASGNPGCACEELLPAGASCSAVGDCESLGCEGGVCTFTEPGPEGAPCGTADHCLSGLCFAARCVDQICY